MTSIRSQLLEPKSLGAFIWNVKIRPMPTVALAESYRFPASRLVAGACKLLGIGKTFGHLRHITKTLQPLFRQGPSRCRKDLRSAVGMFAFRPEKQVTPILHHQFKPFLPLRISPADPVFAILESKSRRSPSQQSDPFAIDHCHLPQKISDRWRLPQIMSFA